MTDGEILRARRLELGMTAEELGQAIGYSENTILRWERGEMAMRNPATIDLLLKGLKNKTPATG